MTVRAQEDSRLIKRVLAGDKNAFAYLVDAYEARLYGLALRHTGSQTDAEDLTQEIFVAIYKSLPKFRGDSALSTWVYRVAMNHCMEYRRRKRPESLPFTDELDISSDNWRENPHESARKQELASKIEQALQHLPQGQRDVVTLHELHGLTYQEVASAMNLPVGTVKSRLSNAFRKLRDLLGDYVKEEDLSNE